tara:strand:+ start:29631 stop:30437 length:807 start_codon:yes stop_codon:yes gene_type:complete
MTSTQNMQDAKPLEYVGRYGDREFRYHLCYLQGNTKATIRVHVHTNGIVQVDAPGSAQLSEIKSAVQRRARWILKHLDNIETRNRDVRPREWVSGESMLYLGRRYVLKITPNSDPQEVTCKLISGQLRVQGKNLSPGRIQKAVERWYRERAKDVFQRRLGLLIEMLPWTKTAPPWRLLEMQTQWGSCSPEGTILMNPHLIKAPTRAVDYVLLHELCHLIEHNHSPRFYGMLDRFMPEWRAIKSQLDESAELLLRDTEAQMRRSEHQLC